MSGVILRQMTFRVAAAAGSSAATPPVRVGGREIQWSVRGNPVLASPTPSAAFQWSNDKAQWRDMSDTVDAKTALTGQEDGAYEPRERPLWTRAVLTAAAGAAATAAFELLVYKEASH